MRAERERRLQLDGRVTGDAMWTLMPGDASWGWVLLTGPVVRHTRIGVWASG